MVRHRHSNMDTSFYGGRVLYCRYCLPTAAVFLKGCCCTIYLYERSSCTLYGVLLLLLVGTGTGTTHSRVDGGTDFLSHFFAGFSIFLGSIASIKIFFLSFFLLFGID